jgi:hypothetical protein
MCIPTEDRVDTFHPLRKVRRLAYNLIRIANLLTVRAVMASK